MYTHLLLLLQIHSDDITYAYEIPPRRTLVANVDTGAAEEEEEEEEAKPILRLVCVGDKKDVLDTYKKWLEGTIINIRKITYEVTERGCVNRS